MKIHIDLEVSQDEIPLVTELLVLLRSLKTASATTTTTTSTTVATAASSPPIQQPPEPSAPAPAATIAPTAPAAVVPTTAVPAPTTPITAKQQYKRLLGVAGESTEEEASEGAAQQQQQLVSELRAVMEQASSADQAVDEFFAEFSEIVFSIDRVQRNQSILPFVSLLPRLPEPFKTKVRDKLIQKVLKHLTLKRPVDCNRMDFFAYAEAFAALVKVEFVNVSGAITTITTLLQKPESRCAAVTMLGKTVELCLHLLNEKCDVAKLAELRVVLGSVAEEAFRYDVNYIDENMGWTTPLPLSALNAASDPVASRRPAPATTTTTTSSSSTTTPTAAAAAVPPTVPPTATTTTTTTMATTATPIGRLVCKSRFQGHTDKIFTLCYDTAREALVSSGRDGLVLTWDADGRIRDRVVLPGQYTCSMDINPRTRSLFLCGVPTGQVNVPPALMLYSLSDAGAWTLVGNLDTKISGGARIVSCVEALVQDQGNKFATGESLSTESGGFVRIYDAEAGAIETLQPLVSFREHEDFITSLTNHPSAEGMLFSGSRDGTIRLWDQRQAKSAAVVGLGPRRTAAAATGTATAPDMITCVNASGCLLASGSLDGQIRLWDLRSLAMPSFVADVDGTPVLKVAIAPQSTSSYPILAVSTNSKAGLYLSFPAASKTTASLPLVAPDTACFYDLVWGDRDDTGATVLFAAGEELRTYQTLWE